MKNLILLIFLVVIGINTSLMFKFQYNNFRNELLKFEMENLMLYVEDNGFIYIGHTDKFKFKFRVNRWGKMTSGHKSPLIGCPADITDCWKKLDEDEFSVLEEKFIEMMNQKRKGNTKRVFKKV